MAFAFLAQTATPDEAAIRDIVAKYVAARETQDEAATRALFTADADQLVSSGEWRRGRENLVRGAMASSRQNEGKRTITIETVRLIGPAAAIADGRYEIAPPDGPVRRMWATFVMVKDQGVWRITAIRNMLPSSAAQQPR